MPLAEAQQLATHLAWLMHRSLGRVLTGALFVLPSLAILIGRSWVCLRVGEQPLVAGVFLGLQPAVMALVLPAA